MKKSVILLGLFCSSLFAGDVIITPGGGSGSSDAAKLQGKEISTNVPTASQALVWNDTIKQWVPTSISVASTVSDTAYDATSWDGVTTFAPSKNAVRDKIETLGTAAYTASTAYDAAGAATAILASPTFTGTVTTPNITLSGNQSAAAWTTSGLRLKGIAGTLTDTTSSGTVAAAYTNKLGGNTIAASSATTFTDYISLYASEATAGTNVTLTNKWALGADSLYVGTSNPFKVTNAGAVSVGSTLTLGTSGILLGGTNLIEQRNGTSAQGFNFYNTTDSGTTNYERGFNRWSSNVLEVGTEAGGTGSSRSLRIKPAANIFFSTASTDRWTLNTSGHLVAGADSYIIKLGASADVGLGHNAAGVFEINSGTLGTFRDLKLRNLETTGTAIVDDTTDSTTSTTGSLKTAGGLGVAKAVNVGTTLSVGTAASGMSTGDISASESPTAGIILLGSDGAKYIQRTGNTLNLTGFSVINLGSGQNVVGSAGTSIKNIRHGISGAMTGGAVTVTDTACTANTRYFFTTHTLGTVTTPKAYYASTRTASTSFVITSSDATDTSTVDWMAVEP